MRLIFIILLSFFFNKIHSQNVFYYSQSFEQNFKLRPKTATDFFTINLDRNEIKQNTLFKIDNKTTQFIIPESGYYEISGSFNFNLSTKSVDNSRAGINFGFIKIKNQNEGFIAAIRFSFSEKNENTFQRIYIYPTVVYLEKDVIIAPAISTGLLDNTILNAKIGCEKFNKNCVSFEWKLIKLNN